MERLIDQRGSQTSIRCDNGSEFISHKLEQWCGDDGKQITLQFIRPGKPMQNAFTERRNGITRWETRKATLAVHQHFLQKRI